MVDPIDGTRNFVRGIPIWATLVAFERDGRALVGVASAPALGQRWWAARGEGAHRDDSRIHVSAIRRIEAERSGVIVYLPARQTPAVEIAQLALAAEGARETARQEAPIPTSAVCQSRAWFPSPSVHAGNSVTKATDWAR